MARFAHDIRFALRSLAKSPTFTINFDVKVDTAAGATPLVSDGRAKSGGIALPPTDRTLYGTINGGGPEMQFITYNGRIVIRKK